MRPVLDHHRCRALYGYRTESFQDPVEFEPPVAFEHDAGVSFQSLYRFGVGNYGCVRYVLLHVCVS